MDYTQWSAVVGSALSAVLTLVFLLVERRWPLKPSTKQKIALWITGIAGAVAAALTAQTNLEGALAGAVHSGGAALGTYWVVMKGARVERLLSLIVDAIIGPPPMPPER